MHPTAKTIATPPATLLKTALLITTLLVACLCQIQRARADVGLCATGSACTAPTRPGRHFIESLPGRLAAEADGALRRSGLSDEEYLSFSGVGAVVCSVNGERRASTAFLVGGFDIGVTVAHTFEQDGAWAQPAECVYTSIDSLGQIRERIPVSYIKTQWQTEAGAYGHPTKDFAVLRLARPSQYAQRTMPLGKFSGAAAPVAMIGFKSDIEADTIKRKTRGTAYEPRANGRATSGTAGFIHDMDSHGLAAGAPVMDERNGVIIGMHTGMAASRNTMITMNEWLERTLRAEMQSQAKVSE
jgi:hypothetical protein